MKEKNPFAVRITQQYRRKNGMTYELLGDGNRLVVRMFPRETPTEPDEWRCEACDGADRDEVLVSVWGPTRADALSAVGRRWDEHTRAPKFDWLEVAKALEMVRAI